MSTALEIITAARVITQTTLTLQELAKVLSNPDDLTEAEVQEMLDSARNTIERNINN